MPTHACTRHAWCVWASVLFGYFFDLMGARSDARDWIGTVGLEHLYYLMLVYYDYRYWYWYKNCGVDVG